MKKLYQLLIDWMTTVETPITNFFYFEVKCRHLESRLNKRVKKAEKFCLLSLLK